MPKKNISEKILYKGNWLSLKETTYKNNDGQIIKWESVERKQNETILIIIAKCICSAEYVLIRQYRPTTENYVIGFPAGIAKSDDIKKEAFRELKEETGYLGKIVKVSPLLKLNAGVINDNCRIVNVEIDDHDPQNINPKQSLEPAEEIEVILKKKETIKNYILQQKEKGDEIGVGLWYEFAN